MKLSDLSPEEQSRIVANRVADSKAFREVAMRSRDPLLLHTLLLEAEARAFAVHIDYLEETEEGE